MSDDEQTIRALLAELAAVKANLATAEMCVAMIVWSQPEHTLTLTAECAVEFPSGGSLRNEYGSDGNCTMKWSPA